VAKISAFSVAQKTVLFYAPVRVYSGNLRSALTPIFHHPQAPKKTTAVPGDAMKRCPQCEFIYEDDQSLCDMDGVLLVFDSRKLPNLHALTTVPQKPQPKRNRAVPAFATVILALVLSLVYYVTTHRQGVQDTDIPPIPIAASNSEPAPVTVPATEPQPSQPAAAEERKPTTTKPAAVAAAASVKKPAAKTAATAETAQEIKTEPKKEESKVGSIIKKTGRILKKPFKF
jgi:predicted secreted protein